MRGRNVGQQKKSSKLTKNPIKTKTFFELEKKPKIHGKSYFFFTNILHSSKKRFTKPHKCMHSRTEPTWI